MPSVSLTTEEAAAQLIRTNTSWSPSLGQPATVTYAYRASAPDTMPRDTAGFVRFSEEQILRAERAFTLWSDVANVTFMRVGTGTTGDAAYSNNATILLADYTAGAAGSSAFSFFPGSTNPLSFAGDMWHNLSFPLNAFVHENGHAIGLSHPSDYDSSSGQPLSYDTDASYIQDSQQYTVMSYFDQSETGVVCPIPPTGPQMDDIAAAQLLYGANYNTRIGDTIYGFHSNSDRDYMTIASSSEACNFCIWDGGGNDTIDMSGYSQDARIDLRAETFSDVGGWIFNISIARGVIIENAIGGDGNDSVTGNDAANTFTGNGGNDVIFGGLGLDTSSYNAASASATWHRNPDGSWTVTAGSEGTDALTAIERAHFSDRDLYLDPAKETLFGDGTSDVLFRNISVNGATGVWAVQGSTITTAATIGFIGSDWTLVTTGDFNGDGKDDLIWLHAGDGVAAEWQMNGATPTSSAVIGGVGSTWHVIGAGDFNRDGISDLLWRANDGTVAVWNMNGYSPTSAAVIGQVDANWQVWGVADFDGDGHDEILWRHSNGLVATWSTDGSSITGAANIGYVDTSWTLAGTGDFNGDGRADILWVHSGDGAVVIWEMNGSTIQNSGLVGSVGSAWHVADVGDYNGDGKDDLLWRHDNGVVAVWTMDGTAVTAAGIAGTISTDWSII